MWTRGTSCYTDTPDAWQEMLFAHLAPQAPRLPPADGAAKYVALLSGLGVGEGGHPARLALAVDYLGGFLGGATEQAMAAQARALTLPQVQARWRCKPDALLCSWVAVSSVQCCYALLFTWVAI